MTLKENKEKGTAELWNEDVKLIDIHAPYIAIGGEIRLFEFVVDGSFRKRVLKATIICDYTLEVDFVGPWGDMESLHSIGGD